jgi:hypothetical protein
MAAALLLSSHSPISDCRCRVRRVLPPCASSFWLTRLCPLSVCRRASRHVWPCSGRRRRSAGQQHHRREGGGEGRGGAPERERERASELQSSNTDSPRRLACCRPPSASTSRTAPDRPAARASEAERERERESGSGSGQAAAAAAAGQAVGRGRDWQRRECVMRTSRAMLTSMLVICDA